MNQVLSGDKRDVLSSQTSVMANYPENKEIQEDVKKLTGVINDKQRLIVGVTQKLGEFITGIRTVRKSLDQLKEDFESPDVLSPIEKYAWEILTSLQHNSPLIAIQNDVETWHKNMMSDEGMGINIYEVLKHLNDLFYKDRQEVLDYYQNLMAKKLTSERETYEVLFFFIVVTADNR